VDARNYWIVTVTPQGKPHSRPVWGVWLDDERLYFDTGSRIGTNLIDNNELTVHLDSGDQVVIVEGTARRANDDADAVARFLTEYNAKYAIQLSAPPGALFVVNPRVAYGWISDPTGIDYGAVFGSTGTRWDFE
jgi:hypothetical protein